MDGLNHLIDGIEEQVKLENTRIEEQISHINVRISELESAKTTSDDEELKLIETRIDELNLTKMRLQQQWKSIRKRSLERLTRIFENGVCGNPADRIMKLQFRNEISKSILTGEEFSVEVALVDSTTNNIVETGQESSAKVEIVVLNGGIDDDLTGEAFKGKIVPEMEGKKPLLKGNPHVKLQRGKASVDKISFRHHTIKIKPSWFRLGARIANQIFDGVRVNEAMTKTFTVKDYRYKYNSKRRNPLLSDEVFRLIHIGRRGNIVKDLKDNNIVTVEDFLIQLLRNPERLQRITKMGARKWEETVENARRASPRDRRMYCYINSEGKMGVAFNVLGQVLGLYLNYQYSPTTMLSETHKAVAQELLSSAYKHGCGVESFDDEHALERYLTALRPSDSRASDYRGDTVGESSSRSHFPFQSSISSDMEIDCDDMGIIVNDDILQHSAPQPILNSETWISGFDDFLKNAEELGGATAVAYDETGFDDMDTVNHSMFDDLETLFPGFDEFHKYAEEQGAPTAVAYDESGGVEISKRLKGWKKLSSVFRVFSIIKKLYVGVHHNKKKQKTR